MSCDRPAGRQPMSWTSAVDIPINFPVEIGKDLNSVEYIPDDGVSEVSVIMDLRTESLTVFDKLSAVEKLTGRKIEYIVDVNSKTQMGSSLLLYALFVPEEKMDYIANMDLLDLYDLITENDELYLASRYRYISLFGKHGLEIPEYGLSSKEMVNSPVNDSLCSIIFNAKSCGWRWIAKVDKNEFDSLGDTGYGADIIDVRVRFRFSGVNNIDSLLVW
jgi:hypothetical protein